MRVRTRKGLRAGRNKLCGVLGEADPEVGESGGSTKRGEGEIPCGKGGGEGGNKDDQSEPAKVHSAETRPKRGGDRGEPVPAPREGRV